MADYRINVIIDPKTRAGSRQVENDLNRIQGVADGVTSSIKRMLGILGGAAVLRQTVSALATFEQTMSSVKAVSGATGDEFELLRKKAKDLGSSTRFGATEAATALLELSKAGFSVAQSLETVDKALMLAQAGGVELTRGTEITVNALTAFRLATDQSGRVVDVLTKAANDSVTDISELGEALKFAGPVAASLGLSLEDTVAALETLAQSGLKASLGGTGLRIVLSNLEAPTKEVRKVLQEYGITTDEVKISQVGLTAALRRLEDAGIDTGAAFDLFGQRGSTAALVLKSGIASTNAFADGLKHAGGTARNVAGIMDDNLNGALLKMKASLGVLIIQLGEAGVTKSFTGLFQALNNGIHFLSENAETVARIITFLVDLLGVKFATMAIGKAIAAVRAFGVALATNPVGLLATAITIAITALVAFGDQIKITEDSSATVRDFMILMWQEIKDAIQTVVDTLVFAFTPAMQDVGNVVEEGHASFRNLIEILALVGDSLVGVFSGVTQVLKVVFSDVKTSALALLGVLVDLFNGFLSLVERGGASLYATIKGSIDTIVQWVELQVNKILALTELVKVRGNPLNVFDEKSAGKIVHAQQAFDDTIEALKKAGTDKSFEENISAAFKRVADQNLFKVDNPFKDEMEKVGKQSSEAFKIGFEALPITKFFQSIFDRLDALSEERKAKAKADADKAAAEAAKAASGAPGAPTRAPGTLVDPDAAVIERKSKILQDYNRKLQDEIRLLGLSWREREVANEILQLENDLREDGVKLTDAQRDGLRVELQRLQTMRMQDDVLHEIRGPMDDILFKQDALNSLFQSGRITVEEYNRALRQLGEQAKQSQVGLGGLADVVTEILEPAFRNVEDAFVDFVTTGKFSFSELVDSMLRDIARLLVQQGLKMLLSLLTGGVGGALGGLAGAFLGGGGGGGALGILSTVAPMAAGGVSPSIPLPSP
jgi:TP901 family phage tail tape measure protein